MNNGTEQNIEANLYICHFGIDAKKVQRQKKVFNTLHISVKLYVGMENNEL